MLVLAQAVLRSIVLAVFSSCCVARVWQGLESSVCVGLGPIFKIFFVSSILFFLNFEFFISCTNLT